MSDKISALTEQTSGTLHDDDLLVNVDVSDTTMAASGTNKKSKWSSIKATLKTYFDTLYALASHTHSISDVTSLQTTLDGKAASSHTHSISDVTGLQTALDGKAASSHTHAISDVTGLQTALDGKAASSHTHSASDLTSLPLRLSVPFSDQTTDFTTGTKFTFTWRFGATTLSSTPVDVTVAPTGSAAQFDVTKNGTTIYSTKPTIDAGETSTSTAATPAVLSTTSIANGDVIAIIIDQKGSSTAGKGGVITFLGTLTV